MFCSVRLLKFIGRADSYSCVFFKIRTIHCIHNNGFCQTTINCSASDNVFDCFDSIPHRNAHKKTLSGNGICSWYLNRFDRHSFVS